jgi:hypothetical protein
MIKYALVCEGEHAFESWFPDSESYEVQSRRGLIACPECNSTRVAKAIMAPAVAAGRAPAAPLALLDERQRQMREFASRLRKEIIANTDDVGERFPQEARAIHVGDAPARSIRGQASLDEARALVEDGVGVLPLPYLPDDRN